MFTKFTGPDRFRSADTDGDETEECKSDVRFVSRFHAAKKMIVKQIY